MHFSAGVSIPIHHSFGFFDIFLEGGVSRPQRPPPGSAPASVVWSPYVKADISRIEMVQRKAVFNDFSSYSSVSSMLTKLKWQSLEQRRTNAIIIMFYKITKDLISINFSQHIHPITSCTQGHLNRFISLPARLNCYYYSFSLGCGTRYLSTWFQLHI